MGGGTQQEGGEGHRHFIDWQVQVAGSSWKRRWRSCQGAVGIWQPGLCPPSQGDDTSSLRGEQQGASQRRWRPQPPVERILGKKRQVNLAQGPGERGRGGRQGLGTRGRGGRRWVTSGGWSRDCGGGRPLPAPGRRAGEWSLSGWPRTNPAHARWHHTSCWNRGCLTCCGQRNRVSSRAVPGAVVTGEGEGRPPATQARP